MSNPRFPKQEKIVMEFPQLNDRQRIKNYSECDTPDEYLYHSISPFANSCFTSFIRRSMRWIGINRVPKRLWVSA